MTASECDVLVSAGWSPDRDAGYNALHAMLTAVSTVSPDGTESWEPFPAAESALRAFHGLVVPPAGPGTDVAATGCVVDPARARFTVRAAAAFGKETGSRLFPLGATDAEAPLFVDENGRLFVVDPGGWWILGESVEEGLIALAEGRAPRRVAPVAHHWQLGRLPDEDVVADLVKTGMVLVYVLHRHGLLATRAVRFRVVGLRGHGPVRLDEVFRLAPGSLDDSAEHLLRDVREAMGSIPLGAAEKSVELLPGTSAKRPSPGVTCTVSAGRQGTGAQGLTVRLEAGTRTVLEKDAGLAGARDELSGYAGQRLVTDDVPLRQEDPPEERAPAEAAARHE
ncbi:SUKH-3 domain-containing protein [Streptomyces sp. I05A-00742]|uniref:SUKH-3 domain-containing protein n=1 Tax=Streptomyces sp. I05A-00742 TaxID=2732853 RepID=UPI001487CCCD|nr:SUKH-3 domain-containing protein [Streptomyces sp. I05A-00742]